MHKANGRSNKAKKKLISKDRPKSNKSNKSTETLSSLLKSFEASISDAKSLLQKCPELITRARLKENWSSQSIKSANTCISSEIVAINTTNFIETTISELEEKIESINSKKDQALEFARNCFSYLNNVHKDTCLGEAGKIMLDLFDKGELTGDIIFGLLDHAESLSKSKNLPFSNKLTKAQSKAIDFMVEERDQRITPTIEDLQSYIKLYKSVSCWTPLLEALINDDIKGAQKIVDSIPD